MLIYPVYYHSAQEGRYSNIHIVCYDENQNKILVRSRYPYSFYVSGVEIPNVQECLSALVGVSISENIVEGRSTRNAMCVKDFIRIDCDNVDVRNNAIRLFQNNGISVHEINNALTPLLKMLQERDVQYYSWMEIDVEEASDNISIGRKEYIGDILTLKLHNGIRPPPPFSIFSIDLECNSVDWDVMCDASSNMDNDIKMACITFVHGDVYKEYAVCYGPDISHIWRKYNTEDVKVMTATSELHLIQLIFAFIQKLDPDIIVGHNIAGFDIPYIITRYQLLCMRERIPLVIPNISRFHNVVVKPFSTEWNNNQVSMSGKLLHVPGRIWIDTLVLAARGFLGIMENNKLDTLAKVHLGMSKNDVSHKDMFAWFSLWNRWNGRERGENISMDIDKQYQIGFRKYNKELPPIPARITIDDINKIIVMINVMNQRGTRKAVYTKNEGMKMNKDKVYKEVREECQSYINKWNMPWIDKDQEEERIKALWWIVARYCVHDTRIPYRILALNNIVSVLMEQSNIFCVSINDILCRGQMHAVTSSQYKKARKLGYIVDLVEKGDPSKLGRKPGGGYVGKGAPGMKIKDQDSVMLVWDFKSLYPTIIIATNICFTTWVPYEKRDKEVTRDMCNIVLVDDVLNKETQELYPPVEHWFLKKEILQGIVPSILWDQYHSRDSIKTRMRTADAVMKAVYSAQEKAVKVGMNSAYGAFGTEHSYICNKACGDATTAIGRRSIKKVNAKLEDKGHTVVYNDTDSAMVIISGVKERFNNDVENIKSFGADLSAELSSHFPYPMQLEMENIFLSFLLLGPKMYMAIKCDGVSTDLLSYGMMYIDANNLRYSKGVASVRRDKYALYKEIHAKIQELILLKYDLIVVGAILEKFITAIWKLKDNYSNSSRLEDKMSYNMGISAKAVSGSGNMALWVTRYEHHYRRKPIKGERFKLLVCEGGDPNKHTKSSDKLYTIDWMEKEGKKLDIIHYLTCFESKGGVIELINLAYDKPIQQNAMRDYYIPMLQSYGRLGVPDDDVDFR